MILTRTPLRICLGGGGTDVKEYYEKHGGFVVSAALNQYIYVVIHKHFEKNIRLCYSRREIVQTSDEVRHPVVHEAMKLFKIAEGGFEIISFADIPSDTGLGTSSSFTVGLITALAAYKGITLDKVETAEMACHIERDLLNEAGGKQDQYIAAFGGITRFSIAKNGEVGVHPVEIPELALQRIRQSILLFYTGIRRRSPKVQRELIRGVRKESKTLSNLHNIKRLGIETEQILRSGEIDRYADCLREHWESKQQLSDAVSNGRINRLHQLAMESGATGGKLIGAGGGGYLLVMCPGPEQQTQLRNVLSREGLEELHYQFDFNGTTLLVNDTFQHRDLAPVPT